MKICLVGDTSVGKTSLSYNLAGLEFDCFSEATIGASYHNINTFDLGIDNALDTKISLWDTAGQERYRSLIPMYSKSSDVIILVLCKDPHWENSFWKESLNYWIKYCNNNSNSEARMIIIFSKIDIDRCVPNADDIDYVNKKLNEYDIEANILNFSAKENIGKDKLLNEISRLSKIIKNKKRLNYLDDFESLDTNIDKKCCTIM